MYSQGGYIPGATGTVTIDDDECFLSREGRCVRTDERHHADGMYEIYAWGGSAPTKVQFGPCIHRHVEPVTTLDGTLVARLCLRCDAQLPA